MVHSSNYYAELLARAHSGKGARRGGGRGGATGGGATGGGSGNSSNSNGRPSRWAAHAHALRALLPTYPYGITLLVCVGCAMAWGFQHNSLSYDYLESPLYFEVVARMYGPGVVEAAFAVAAATPEIAALVNRDGGGMPATGGSGQPCPSGPKGSVSNPAAVVAALSVAVSGAEAARRTGDHKLDANELAALERNAIQAAARVSGGPDWDGPGGGGGPGTDNDRYRRMIQYCPQWANGYIALLATHYWMGAVGSALAVPFICWLGVRWVMTACGLAFSIGHVVLAMFPSVNSYFYIRGAVDTALSAMKVAAILTVAEVARPRSRGRLLASLLAAWTAGFCAALFMWEGSKRSRMRQMTLRFDREAGDTIWRNLHLTNAALMLPFALLSPLIPDTPAALMRRGLVVKAYGALRRLRGVRPGLWPQTGGTGGGGAGRGAGRRRGAPAVVVPTPTPPPPPAAATVAMAAAAAAAAAAATNSARPPPVPEDEEAAMPPPPPPPAPELATMTATAATTAPAAAAASPSSAPPAAAVTAAPQRLGSSGSGALARDAVDAEFETLMAALAAARQAPACDAFGGALGRGCFGAASRGGQRRAWRLDGAGGQGGNGEAAKPPSGWGGFFGGGKRSGPQAPGTLPNDASLPVAMALAGVPAAAAAMLAPPPDAAAPSAKPAAAAAAARKKSSNGPTPAPEPPFLSVYDAPFRATFFSRMCRPGLITGLVAGFTYGATGAPLSRFILPVMVRAVPTLADCGDVPARVVEASTLAPLVVLGSAACLLLIDRVGRRGWFFVTGGVLLVMNVLCGSLLAVGEVKRHELNASANNPTGRPDPYLIEKFRSLMMWVPIAALSALALFNAFFFVGFYHLSFTVPAELQPLASRVHALAAAMVGQQLGTGLVALFGPPMLCTLRSATFFYLALTVGLSLALVGWLMPEPNGLPLEEVWLRAFGTHPVWASCVIGKEAAALQRAARLAAKGGPGPLARLCSCGGGGAVGGRGQGGGPAAVNGVRKTKGKGNGGALSAWWARRREAAAWRRAVRAYRRHQGPPLPGGVGGGAGGGGGALAIPGVVGGVGVGAGGGGAAAPYFGAGPAPRGPTPPRARRGQQQQQQQRAATISSGGGGGGGGGRAGSVAGASGGGAAAAAEVTDAVGAASAAAAAARRAEQQGRGR